MIDETEVKKLINKNDEYFDSISLGLDNPILVGYLDERQRLEIAVEDYVQTRDAYNAFYAEHATKRVYLNPAASHDETTDYGIHRSARRNNENYIIQLKKSRKELINSRPRKMSEEELQRELQNITDSINAAIEYGKKLEDITSPESRRVVYEYRRINLEPNLIEDEYLEDFNDIKRSLIQKNIAVETLCKNVNSWSKAANGYRAFMPKKKKQKSKVKIKTKNNRTNKD